MDALDIARWQFGIITVYHFLFVPLTLSLSMIVAGMHTAWYRTGNPTYERMTKFWGKLFLINFAIGVVTGIVQEFQFGMNWSDYSRFVGDVFGAPLAMEALVAFFLESTFLGLWIFGWGRLKPKLHLATIWAAAIGTWLSAYFIIAANSWMQHPVGFWINPETNRAELKSIGEVLTNVTALSAYPHVLTAAVLTGGAFLAGVSAWWLRKAARGEARGLREAPLFRKSLRIGLVAMVIGGLGVVVTGDQQGKIMYEQQPMKMAAAEALWETEQGAGFSLFTIGTLDGQEEVFSIKVPGVLAFLATQDPNGTVEGINEIQRQLEEKYGPGDYRPNIPVAYWSFRLMMGFGGISALLGVAGLWFTRRKVWADETVPAVATGIGDGPRAPAPPRWLWTALIWTALFPVLGNSFGWIFTEMARQPWVVYGQMFTAEAVSPNVGPGLVWTSLIGLSLLYGALAVVEVGLTVRYIKAGPPPASIVPSDADGSGDHALVGATTDVEGWDGERPLTFAY